MTAYFLHGLQFSSGPEFVSFFKKLIILSGRLFLSLRMSNSGSLNLFKEKKIFALCLCHYNEILGHTRMIISNKYLIIKLPNGST